MVGVRATVGAKAATDESLEAQVRAAGTVLLGLVGDVNAIEAGVRVRLAQRAQREFAAVESAALAELKAAGATDREVTRRAAAGGTRSRKESSKLSKRADAVKENPTLAEKLGDGSLGADHVDAIARAAAESGGDAAKDEALIRELEESKPDDAHKVTNKWLERRNEDGAQSRYDRQRSRRKVIKGRHISSGCSTIELHGSDEDRQEMWQRIEQRAHQMYLSDGGRDVPDHEHPRTYQQRLFDAAYELIMQKPAAGRVAAAPETDDGTTPASSRAPHARSLIHVALTVDDEAEGAIRAASLNGQGYLPDSVLERYACGSMVGGTVFNQRGQILWYGRARRYASPAQFEALVARDHGCVLCGADPSRCEAHHLDPFNAPVAGETNIDDMALVCSPCHHWIHDQKLTLFRNLAPPDSGSVSKSKGPRRSEADRRPGRQSAGPDQHANSKVGSPLDDAARKPTWHTRPATPDEIAPSTPSRTQRPPSLDDRRRGTAQSGKRAYSS